jgi:hypothetical protein
VETKRSNVQVVDPLSELSEEMEMLIEVAEKIANARVNARHRGKDLSRGVKGQISGKETENIIRDHLIRRVLNMSRTRVHISGSAQEIDLLLLKSEVDPKKSVYLPSEVDTVLEIKNNAVADQTTETRTNFDELKEIAGDLRFAYIVLSERITYTHRVTPEGLGYPAFELISRRRSAGRWMESKDEIMSEYKRTIRTGERAMWETGQWNELIEYLSSSSS